MYQLDQTVPNLEESLSVPIPLAPMNQKGKPNEIPRYSENVLEESDEEESRMFAQLDSIKQRRLWAKEEDEAILKAVDKYGEKQWSLIARKLGEVNHIEGRTGKQCRERYYNYLRDDLKNNRIKDEEERTLLELVVAEGTHKKWVELSKKLSGRSENMVKNHFYSLLKRSTSILLRAAEAANYTPLDINICYLLYLLNNFNLSVNLIDNINLRNLLSDLQAKGKTVSGKRTFPELSTKKIFRIVCDTAEQTEMNKVIKLGRDLEEAEDIDSYTINQMPRSIPPPESQDPNQYYSHLCYPHRYPPQLYESAFYQTQPDSRQPYIPQPYIPKLYPPYQPISSPGVHEKHHHSKKIKRKTDKLLRSSKQHSKHPHHHHHSSHRVKYSPEIEQECIDPAQYYPSDVPQGRNCPAPPTTQLFSDPLPQVDSPARYEESLFHSRSDSPRIPDEDFFPPSSPVPNFLSPFENNLVSTSIYQDDPVPENESALFPEEESWKKEMDMFDIEDERSISEILSGPPQ